MSPQAASSLAQPIPTALVEVDHTLHILKPSTVAGFPLPQ